MRPLPTLWRMAEEMQRLAFPRRSPFSAFYDDFFNSHNTYFPWNRLSRLQQELENDVVPKVGKDGYQVSLDVAQFKPNELTVKVVDNNVVVEGKYDGREDEHGFISKHFVRSFSLPRGYKAEQAMSTLSSDGILTVNVPKPAGLEDKTAERVIPIHQTGPAHLNVKNNAPVEDKSAEKKDTN
ncbi:PREDICTED: heat shock protein 23-like [Rhagoletis zephyria]|uniref:heat shock protein 23-like n=1 Tax=Rhagoletis zephyria TaxID=28612 RepID=UPI00081156E4|nr:PREDICTED: heat shock protein 23-like [Rhagoletis zephyria]